MTFRSIRFENIGPIGSGEVRRRPISVFVGPNGSGKSIAARMIHGACYLDMSRVTFQMDLYADKQAATARIMSYAGHSITRRAGMPIAAVPSRGARTSSLEVDMGGQRASRIDYAKLGRGTVHDAASPPPLHDLDGGPHASMYVPAGRTGIAQSFISIARIRNDLLRHALAQSGADRSDARMSGAPLPAALRRALPEHLEMFYDAIFESLAGSPSAGGGRTLSRIFGGSVGVSKNAAVPTTTYKNEAGFESEITSAASGILSSFPILECAGQVKRGGLLIVEEPEAHLEPEKQLLLVEELASMSREMPFDLMLITHSDHTVDSVLSLVARRMMRPDDLGLYYFRRESEKYAHIRQVEVYNDGSAEQELFETATASLCKRFV